MISVAHHSDQDMQYRNVIYTTMWMSVWWDPRIYKGILL